MSTQTIANLETAISTLLAEMQDNEWFTGTFWPENQQRVRLMLSDILRSRPPSPSIRVLDVGCFNGYISFLLALLGYDVTATDASPTPDAEALFVKAQVEFVHSNLNELEPLLFIPPKSFDVIVMGEVIEHVLNHPLGLMHSIARLTRSDGILVLTTPNPSTVMNAVRLLLGHTIMWGTSEFVEQPKIQGQQIICRADIHYREYTTSELSALITNAGFIIEEFHYLSMGISSNQSVFKRSLKRTPVLRSLMHTRPFGCTQYVLARAPSD